MFYLLLFLLIVIAFFDLYWILRLVFTRLLSKIRPPLSLKVLILLLLLLLLISVPTLVSLLQDKGETYNICWTTDIDYFCHMNNGKYFREMDFGRCRSYI